MNPDAIKKIIEKSNTTNNFNFLKFLLVYKKQLKKIFINLLIVISILKPTIPASLLGNIADAFVHEYKKIETKYKTWTPTVINK